MSFLSFSSWGILEHSFLSLKIHFLVGTKSQWNMFGISTWNQGKDARGLSLFIFTLRILHVVSYVHIQAVLKKITKWSTNLHGGLNIAPVTLFWWVAIKPHSLCKKCWLQILLLFAQTFKWTTIFTWGASKQLLMMVQRPFCTAKMKNQGGNTRRRCHLVHYFRHNTLLS